MATTAQFQQFVMDTETVGAGWKLYHYEPGTTNLKPVWEDRDKNATAAQPLVADANGVITGYFDGLYDLAVYDANDVLKYTWDEVFFADTQSVGAEGSGLTAAATLTLSAVPSETYFHVSGSTTIQGISGEQLFCILTFNSSVLLTHSPSFILRNSESRRARIDETCMFVNDGSNVWREVAPPLRLSNNVWLTGRNAADGAEINVVKVNSSNQIEFGGALALFGGAVTATGLITANANIKFPATQVPDADVNTLDDYEEGAWTPVLTAATPGDLAVAYSIQAGRYLKIGKQVRVSFNILTSSFTRTTASGAARITGLPFPVANATLLYPGTLAFQGITKANYTQYAPTAVTNQSYLEIYTGGSGQTLNSVAITEMPSAGTVILYGTVVYEATN